VSGFRDLPDGRRWLQTTAPISPGSSGGPLLLSDGTLVGVTTLSLTEAQNVNFAIPLSSVRQFLASEYHIRNMAAGASLWWHEDDGFSDLSLFSSKYSDREKKAAVQLEKAREEINEGIRGEPPHEVGHYEQASKLAQQVLDSLPEEHKYLAHYVMGKASVLLAWHDQRDAKTVKERELRYRTSHYASVAMQHLSEAAKLKADFAPTFQWLCRHHKSAREWPQALLASDTLVRLMPRSAEALHLRGDCYHELNQLESAKADLEAAIELSPKNGRLYSALSWVLRGMRDFPQAKLCSERQIELRHDLSGAHLDLGYIYRELGQFNKAVSEFGLAKSLGVPAVICDQEIAKCRQQTR
jgi:tetratricopeptide (TPR) repeat protein